MSKMKEFIKQLICMHLFINGGCVYCKKNIHRGRQWSKWIAVEVRKPKSGKVVLVKSTEEFITTGSKIGIATWWNKKDTNGDEHWSVRMQFDDGCDCKSIIAWQLLPR